MPKKDKVTYEVDLATKEIKKILVNEMADPECWPRWAVLIKEVGEIRKIKGTNSKKEAQEHFQAMANLLKSSGCTVYLADCSRPRKPLIKLKQP